jgi:hypothetical protein
MNSLRKWLDALVASLNCFVNGHGPYQVLHVYETKNVPRYFKGKRIEKLRVGEPCELIYEHQKIRCLKCLRVSLEWRLLGAVEHTNTTPGEWQ